MNKNIYSDLDYCLKIVSERSMGFHAAFSFLPEKKRIAIIAIYSFFLNIEISAEQNKSISKLKKLEEGIIYLENGIIIDNPIYRVLDTVKNFYNIDLKIFLEIIKEAKKIVNFVPFKLEKDLEEFSVKYVGNFGRLIIPVLAQKNYNYMNDLAIEFGEIVWYCGQLKSIEEKLNFGIYYFSLENLKKYGYTYKEMREKKINDKLIELLEHKFSKIELRCKKIFERIDEFDEDCILVVSLVLKNSMKYIEKIRKNNYKIYHN